MRHLFAFLVFLLGGMASAADRYVSIAVAQLGIADASWPSGHRGSFLLWGDVRLHGDAVGYLAMEATAEGWRAWNLDAATVRTQGRIVARIIDGADLQGWLTVPGQDQDRDILERLSFRIPAAQLVAIDRETFDRAAIAWHQRQLQDGRPGAAWHRHRLRALNANPSAAPRWQRRSDEDAMDLFTGGRAIAENLQLDRGLQIGDEKGDGEVDLATLDGITIAAIDWKPLLVGKKPALDHLAAAIPMTNTPCSCPASRR